MKSLLQKSMEESMGRSLLMQSANYHLRAVMSGIIFCQSDMLPLINHHIMGSPLPNKVS
jgi:hypothetical protein